MTGFLLGLLLPAGMLSGPGETSTPHRARLPATWPATGALEPLTVEAAAIDSGPVTAFAVAADSAGTIWLACARADDTLRLLRSTDHGLNWNQERWLTLGSPVRQVELLAPSAGNVSLYAFILSAAGDGDLWLWRLGPDTNSSAMPVVAGPDTIDDFAVTLDRTADYYIYCVYVNERRAGRTGGLIRSGDMGATWSPETDFWNAHDPCLIATTGSMVHAVWRYALGGTQIHHAFNRHFGAPRYWSSTRILSNDRYPRTMPLICQADTGDEYWSSVWAFMTVARHDTLSREIEYSWSPTNGDWWHTGRLLGNSFVEQWPVDLAADLTGPGGYIGLLYLEGGILSLDPLRLYWRGANIYYPELWTPPLLVTEQAVAVVPRPRLGYAAGTQWRGPLVLYCTPDSTLHAAATWLPAEGDPGPTITRPTVVRRGGRLQLTGNAPAQLYDASGRIVRSFVIRNMSLVISGVRPGPYFLKPAVGPGRRILITP
jgi:hypothetical protein